MEIRLCSFDGCKKNMYAKNLCAGHYRQQRVGKELTALLSHEKRQSDTCSFRNCKGLHKGKGYCAAHLRHLNVYGEARELQTKVSRKDQPNCSFPECTGRNDNKGLCGTHASQLQRNGQLKPIIPKNPGTWGSWIHHTKTGYILQYKNLNGKREYRFQHRLVMQEHLGRELLSTENVHHKNGVKDDNRIENLELWSTSQPCGQRAIDKLQWAEEIISLYGKDMDRL